ncbi:MAG: histidine kinase [Bacteroidota bacterium]
MPPPPSFPTLFRRSPWVDAAFWIAHGMFWHVIFAPELFTAANLLISGLLTFWQAVATYAHLKWLLEPRLQKRLSTVFYILLLPVLVLGVSMLSWTSLYTFFSDILEVDLEGGLFGASLDYWAGSILGGMGLAMALTGAIYLYYRRREQEKHERELEQARTKAELAYLRGQLNPHFLFNALNSIYFLIPKSPEEAQQALGGFSDLLRYQLYQSEGETVPLTEELQQLNKFVELNRLRMEEDFVVALRVPDQLTTERIPPMLLLPLMENAIKYSPSTGGKVTGVLRITKGRLTFSLSNKIGVAVATPPAAAGEKAGGIGLANIRRRLDLLYPDQHVLETQEQDGHFTVDLEIPLTP